MKTKLESLLFGAALFGSCAVLAGCVSAEVDRPVMVADVPAFEVSDVPIEIESYPHVYYRGGFAYLVDGRWFYRTPTGYVVFRSEPIELARYRTTMRTTARVHVR